MQEVQTNEIELELEKEAKFFSRLTIQFEPFDLNKSKDKLRKMSSILSDNLDISDKHRKQ